jgi:hypothetical protein
MPAPPPDAEDDQALSELNDAIGRNPRDPDLYYRREPPPEQDLERRARISTRSARALSGTSYFQDCDRVLGRPPEGGSRGGGARRPGEARTRLDRSRAGKAGRPAGI